MQLRLIAVPCVVLTSLSFAQAPRPVIAQFPLELKRTPRLSEKDVRSLRTEYQRLVMASGATPVDPAELETALVDLKRQDCDRADDCLKALGQRARALYGMYASLDQDVTRTRVTATGRVVRDDGALMGGAGPQGFSVTVLVEGGTFVEAAKKALAQLLELLAVGKLPSVRPSEKAAMADSRGTLALGPSTSLGVSGKGPAQAEHQPLADASPPPPKAVAATAAVAPEPPKPPEVKVAAETPVREPRILPWAALGAGAALVAGGGLFLGLATSDSARLTPNADGNLPVSQVPLYATAKNKELVGEVLLGVGAVAVAAGAALFVMAPAEAKVAVVPSREGAALFVSGVFP